MVHTLKLKQTIGSSYSVDPDDVINTKRTLTSLGFFKVPDYGITPYPDDQLFEGIKGFQRANGLEVDGIINPDGETETAMSRRPEKPTQKQCKSWRDQLERKEAEFQSMERQLAVAEKTGPESWIKKLKTRIYWTKISIMRLKQGLEDCGAG